MGLTHNKEMPMRYYHLAAGEEEQEQVLLITGQATSLQIVESVEKIF